MFSNQRNVPVYIDATSKIIQWLVSLEQFPIECSRTKTKEVTLANHNEHRQSSDPVKSRSKYM